MTKEKLVQQIELIRQRLETNKKKLTGRADDPKHQILAEMYKVLAKYIKADEEELERLNQQLTTIGEQKKTPAPSTNQPTQDNTKQASEEIVWSEQDEFIKGKLTHLTNFITSLPDDQDWNKDRLKLCAIVFDKQVKHTRLLLTPANEHLHTFVHQQLDIAQKSFLDWHTETGVKLISNSHETQDQLKISQQIDILHKRLVVLLAKTPTSYLELSSERIAMQQAIEETRHRIDASSSVTGPRRLSVNKGKGFHLSLHTIQIKLNRWILLHEHRLPLISSNPTIPVKPQPVQPSVPKSAPAYVAVQISWSDVTFKDGYVEIQSLISISQAYHHLNYSLPLVNARRSFQAFASTLDSLDTDPLEVWVSVRDRTVTKVLNADILSDFIGFLEIKETFGWLEWNVYRGSPQYVDDRQIVSKHPGLNRHVCLRHLMSLQSQSHQIIFVKEFASASENGWSTAASDAFLFTINQGPYLYIIWENEEKSLATYVFKTTAKLYYNALQRIHDYVSSQTIQSKRMRLREGDLQAMKGVVNKCWFVIHDDLRDWRNKLSQLMR